MVPDWPPLAPTIARLGRCLRLEIQQVHVIETIEIGGYN